jgi:tRNA1Val (adenine37-N6)-methyltransferase
MKTGTDAILLSSLIPEIKPKKILDIGTGCGIVALCMAQRYEEAYITAIDVDFESIEEAKTNFAFSKFKERLTAIKVSLQNYVNTESQCFDLIVSNPPFFINSLLSDRTKRNISRHNVSLSQEDLLLCSANLLSENGTLSIILPPVEMEIFLVNSRKYNLFCYSQYLIFDRENKKCKRVVSLFAKSKPCETIAIAHIVLRNADNTYTEAYYNLTSMFLR